MMSLVNIGKSYSFHHSLLEIGLSYCTTLWSISGYSHPVPANHFGQIVILNYNRIPLLILKIFLLVSYFYSGDGRSWSGKDKSNVISVPKPLRNERISRGVNQDGGTRKCVGLPRCPARALYSWLLLYIY